MAATGTPWFRVYCSLSKHPKTYELSKALKKDRQKTVGILIDLFSAVTTYRPDGNLEGLSDADLERWADWRGRKNVLIPSLERVGWLDGASMQRKVHNWPKYTGSYRRAEIQKKYRQRKKPEPEQSDVLLRNTSEPVTRRGEERRREEEQQQATTQSLHAAESFVPDESVSDNLVALPPPATQTDTRGPQLPVTGRMEQPGPDAQPEQKPAMRTTLDARRWKVGGTVESAEDYRAWVSSLGWAQAKTSQKNKDILCSLLKSGPILNADLKAVVTEVMTCTTNPNGGLALSKLRDRLDGRGEATRRRAPGAPTAEDDERNRRNRELAQSVDREENAKRASRFVSQVLTALG